MVDLQRALGLHPGRFLQVTGPLLSALGQQLTHQHLDVAVDHPLPAVHDGVDEVVAPAHEPVLHVNGVSIPVNDPGRYAVQAERPDELPVPNAGATLHRQPTLLPDRLPQPGARVELCPGEVHLSQVPRVVHVEQQEVHVRGQARRRVRSGVQYVHVLLQDPAHGRTPQRPGKIVHLEHPVQDHDYQQRGHRESVRIARQQEFNHFYSVFSHKSSAEPLNLFFYARNSGTLQQSRHAKRTVSRAIATNRDRLDIPLGLNAIMAVGDAAGY